MRLHFALFAIRIFNKTYVIMLSHNLEIPMQRFRVTEISKYHLGRRNSCRISISSMKKKKNSSFNEMMTMAIKK